MVIANKKNFILLKKDKTGIDNNREIQTMKIKNIISSNNENEPTLKSVNKPINKVNALIIHHVIFC